MAAGIMDIGRLVATLGLNTAPFMAKSNGAMKRLQQMSNGFMMIGRTMTRFVTLPMVIAGGAAVNTQKKFEASMTKIIGLVGVSRNQVEKWNKSVLKMSVATGRGPEELADALYFVTSAGIRGAEAMDVLEMSAKAAASGLGETKVIADLVTSAMNAYGKENLSAAQATDILVASVREGKAEANELAGAMGMVLPIASEFGVSFDQVGAAFAGMTRTGTNARVAATQLKAILSAMASPSKQAADAMAEFHISAEDFRKTVKEQGLIQALLDLRAATEGNEAAMSEIFPNIRALMGVLDLLGANVEYNVKIFESLKNASGSLERAFAEVGGTTEQKLNVALAQFKVNLIKIGEILKPFVTKILVKFGDRMNELASAFELMTNAQKESTMRMIAWTAAAGPLFLIASRIAMLAMANPFIALAAALAVAQFAIMKYVKGKKELVKVEEASQEQLKDGTANINKEITSIQNLFSDLKTLTKGTKEWEEVRNKINGTYGEYLDNLITEKTTVGEIEEAMKRVTKARMADLSVKMYQEEVSRLVEVANNRLKVSLGDFTSFVRNNRGALEAATKTDKAPGESYLTFTNALNDAIEKDLQSVAKGSFRLTTLSAELTGNAKKVYESFIGILDTGGNDKLSLDEWLKQYVDYASFKQEIDYQLGNLGVEIDTFKSVLSDMFGEEDIDADVQISLKRINAEIKYTNMVKDGLTEQARLITLIQLHQEKLALLKGDEATKEGAIISDLRVKLKYQKDLESSLSEEARIEGVISKLTKARKLKTTDLAQNSKDLATQKALLASLQLENSAYSDVEKARARIDLAKTASLELDGEALVLAKQQIRLAERTMELADARTEGLGKLAILQMELKHLEEDVQYLEDDKAVAQNKQIAGKKREIALQEAKNKGYNEEQRLLIQIASKEEELKTLTGAAADNLQRSMMLDKVALIDQQLMNGLLTAVEKIQLNIAKVELLRAMTINPALREEYAEQLRLLKLQEEIISGQEDQATGEKEPEKYSKDWFKNLGESLNKLRELKEEGKITGKVFKEGFNSIMGSIVEGVNNYVQAIGGAISQMITGITTLIEAQKQRELSAAGNNAKKREAIEKAYFKKQKKWALAQAIINTALAVGNALNTKPFLPMGLIMAGVAAAAGGIQIATVASQSFAKGGLVYGETLATVGEYPGAQSNPEVIAPLSKLKALLNGSGGGVPKEYEIKIKGRDLWLVLKMEENLQNTY